MISDQLQEEASLYVMGELDAGRAALFEKELAGNAELQALVRELYEGLSTLALTVPVPGAPGYVEASETEAVRRREGVRELRLSRLKWIIGTLLTFGAGILLGVRGCAG